MNFNQTTVEYPRNTNGSLLYSDFHQSTNSYYAMFGAKETVEVVFLTILSLVGSFGNLLVIFSIINDKRVQQHGNIFIINLAVADFMVIFFVSRSTLRRCFQKKRKIYAIIRG